MMMRRDTVRHQEDMLPERERKSLQKIREILEHYQRKITWHSAQDKEMRQHGVSSSGETEEETCKNKSLYPWTKQYVRFRSTSNGHGFYLLDPLLGLRTSRI